MKKDEFGNKVEFVHSHLLELMFKVYHIQASGKRYESV